MSPIILKINDESDVDGKDSEIMEYIDEKGFPVFMFIYMDGCSHCMVAHPEWNKLKDEHFSKQVVVVDVEKDYLSKLEKLKTRITNKIGEIGGFPTMIAVTKNGENIEDYSGERNLDAFKNWIETTIASSGGSKFVGGRTKKTRKTRKTKKSSKKSKKTKRHIKGGRKWSLKYKKSINCNRPRGFSQKQYCKYGRK